MKNMLKFWITVIAVLGAGSVIQAQNIDKERMRRDIEVAENVLATLIKHELEQQHILLGLDVRGTYQPGYGVTFRIPSDHTMPFSISITTSEVQNGATMISNGRNYEYIYGNRAVSSTSDDDESVTLEGQRRQREQSRADSARLDYNNRIIRAAQNFILDYGDFMSQLSPDERIIVTNQNDRAQFFFNPGNRTRISVEGLRGDVTALRQGKLSREQALKKLTVINTETLNTKEPDLEMMSSIFSRLYRPDLSKTYFVQGNVYYERLRDFGAIFYMRVLSSDQRSLGRHYMPTLGLDNLSQEARDKKVTELYPTFEKDLKENILEYGRTIKSLKDDESLILNIILTECVGCGIPATLELSVKSATLKDFASGKIDKETAMSKIFAKKGESQ